MEAPITFVSEQCLTQAEFREWLRRRPPSDVHHYELIHGRIVMTPGAVFGHGRVAMAIGAALHQHATTHDLGVVLDSSTTFELPSGDTLEPDLSFLSRERIETGSPDPNAFVRLVPDLVVEILSPSTARRDRSEKKAIYASNGVREYWLVDHRRRQVTVFHLRGTTFAIGVVVTTGAVPSEVLPNLDLQLGVIFRD